jgi:RimJ/RimL family protein N-acetyltransferase
MKDLLPQNLNSVIYGRMIYLAPITVNELSNSYLSWLNNPKINRFLEVSKNPPVNVNELVEYINNVRLNPLCEVFAIFDIRRNVHVGNIALTHNNIETGVATHGTLVGDELARKMGTGAEASILLNEFIFNYSHVNKIQEGFIAGNIDAKRVLTSMGFSYKKVLHDASQLADGSYQDIYIYEILRHEWEKFKEKMTPLLDFYNVVNMDRKG